MRFAPSMMAAVSSTWALLLGMALLMIGNGLQGTLLGVRASLEGFATSTTGILMSGYYVGFLAGSALAPRLVARVGHVRVFGALASLASVAILVHALFVGPATWLAMRLMSGFAYAGLYVVAESWLNEEATNATRGRLLSVYMVVSLGGVALGQALLNLADPSTPDLFVLVSVLVSLGLVPMLLSASRMPAFEAPSAVGVRQLYDATPTGVLGMFITMIAQGAFFGMGAVYASEVGLSVGEISLFMGLALLGGVLLQWPIGRLSDTFDRRQVIVTASLLAAVLAFAAALLGDDVPRLPLFALVSLFGGVLLPMYSLCIAYTNDYLRPDQMVDASGTLVLIGGCLLRPDQRRPRHGGLRPGRLLLVAGPHQRRDRRLRPLPHDAATGAAARRAGRLRRHAAHDALCRRHGRRDRERAGGRRAASAGVRGGMTSRAAPGSAPRSSLSLP
jgi:MFS family permease